MPENKLTEDEQKAMTEARRASQALLARRQAGHKPVLVDDLTDDNDDYVIMVVPKDFTLTLDGHSPVSFPAGTHQVPKTHKGEKVAEHWYVKAHGCKVFNAPKVKQAEASTDDAAEPKKNGKAKG